MENKPISKLRIINYELRITNWFTTDNKYFTKNKS